MNYIKPIYASNQLNTGKPFRGGGNLLLSALTLFAAATVRVDAATNTVTVCDQASLQSAVTSGGTIQFGCDGTIVLTNTLVISQNAVIDGVGHHITISGNNAVRVFQVNPGVAFNLANLTVANGWVGTNAAQPQFAGDAKGAGLFNDGGTVTLSKVTFSTNSVCGANSPTGGHGMGGAVYQTGGSLFGTNCNFVVNNAEGSAYKVKSGFGAGIFNQSGTVILSDSIFANNIVFGGDNGSETTGNGYGGGIYTTNGQVTLVNCQFSNNLAAIQTNPAAYYNTRGYASGGAIYQESGILNLIGSAFATNRVIALWSARYSTTPGDGNGGALFNKGTVNSTNCSFLGNLAQGGNQGTAGDGQGGAIYNGGIANLVRATIVGNQCIGGRGAVYSLESFYYPSGQGNGGGIYNSNVFLMLESTLNGNVAAGGPGPFLNIMVGDGGEAYGGAIHNRGVFIGTNNTLVANVAKGGDGGVIIGPVLHLVGPGGQSYGGGIFNNTNGTMTLTHLTMANNAAIGGAGNTNTMGIGIGGGIVSSNGTVSLYNSIVANSSGTNVVGSSIVDGGGNLSSDASVSFSSASSHTNMNPLLGVLGNYGGPTQTIPLLPGSPAINSGVAAFSPATDQRGVPRALAGVCDIGAFEVVPLYTISGRITAVGNVLGLSVTAGGNSGLIDGSRNYVITNLPGGTCIVAPTAPGWMFTPSFRVIPLNASIADVNFNAYRLNSLAMESLSGNTMQFAFAGTSGQIYEIQTSSNLVNWVVISTNTISASGVLQFSVTRNPEDGSKYWRAVRK